MQRTFYRFMILSTAVAALWLAIAPKALAAVPDESPFAKGCEVADATLDTMRGGFEIPGAPPIRLGDSFQPVLPFGIVVDGKSTANGQTVAQFTIGNGGDRHKPVTFTETGLGKPDTVAPGLTVTTSLTNQGVLTIIKNTAANTVAHTSQQVSATITGMNPMTDLVRGTLHNALHSSRVLFH
jgi:hypothetical protein